MSTARDGGAAGGGAPARPGGGHIEVITGGRV